MDPKMDAGMATTGFKTFEEAIESGAAPIELTIQQLVDIFDHMLACEVCLVYMLVKFYYINGNCVLCYMCNTSFCSPLGSVPLNF